MTGAQYKACRKALHMDRAQFAQHLGLSKSCVYAREELGQKIDSEAVFSVRLALLLAGIPLPEDRSTKKPEPFPTPHMQGFVL